MQLCRALQFRQFPLGNNTQTLPDGEFVDSLQFPFEICFIFYF